LNIKDNINLITILGPTATGKTNLAVKIADTYNCEIISADSRQIYRKMDIGTGKDLYEYNINNRNIPYHLIDIIDPIQDYSVYSFQREFHKAYNHVLGKNKIPILCGGSGLYIESVLLNYRMFNIKPNYTLRSKLERLSKLELLNFFREFDSNIIKDWKCDTKQRIIRGIEILSSKKDELIRSSYNLDLSKVIVLGIKTDRETVREQITARLKYRFENGMIEEVEQLILDKSVDFKRLNYFGLEYRYIGKYLNSEISYDQLFTKLNTAIHKFAKKQMTFFRHMEKKGITIHWLDNGSFKDAISIINLK